MRTLQPAIELKAGDRVDLKGALGFASGVTAGITIAPEAVSVQVDGNSFANISAPLATLTLVDQLNVSKDSMPLTSIRVVVNCTQGAFVNTPIELDVPLPGQPDSVGKAFSFPLVGADDPVFTIKGRITYGLGSPTNQSYLSFQFTSQGKAPRVILTDDFVKQHASH